ncbi:formamidopyrimidine-DNA glycosylase [Georgenia halophila]|uniref:DNA-(apurinic or apyrimidinic site) lyase n=1 Tax=Georgenia halophila TaxID=620889 RepID=A0ABP8L788_9MICO
MPEGHTVHRLAYAFRELFGGRPLAVSSPQGRFADGAALLDGLSLAVTEAHGKHLFLGFGSAGGDDDDLRWLRVHLGLYGSWTFAGDESFSAPHAIGAPRRRVAEEETPLAGDDGSGVAVGEWDPPDPRGAVRVRILGEHGVADLTGPIACEVVTSQEKAAVQARLGPDPLRPDGDPETFVRRVRARRRAVGELLMDQEVISGVGNVYRAEALYRARVHPRRLGRDIPAARLRAIWADLAELMTDGVATGRIVTTRPEHGGPDPDRLDGEQRYVYRRSGLPCLVCGTKVAEATMQTRRVFWCPRCQRAPRSRT